MACGADGMGFSYGASESNFSVCSSIKLSQNAQFKNLCMQVLEF